MPRPFSAGEREAIRAALLERGRRLFAAQGLRKTSVEELTAAAGISKGAFYHFFASKEELFFELLEAHEARYKADLLEAIARADLPPRARMLALLERSLALLRSEPLFTRLGRAEYELLLRRLPPERVTAHLAGDDAFAERFAAAWADQGVALALPPPLVAGLIRALFFVSMHEEDFTPGGYPAVIAELTALVAARLVPEEER
ncbi:MAG TPA: TetR/AcrR family transcriptional regulator [Chloroflexaceae bacterium]|nr:TetR/AcrR family transcriptional regulator [Chloroflexaceae bacterium]